MNLRRGLLLCRRPWRYLKDLTVRYLYPSHSRQENNRTRRRLPCRSFYSTVPCGRSAHPTLEIRIEVNEDSICAVDEETGRARSFRTADVIV